MTVLLLAVVFIPISRTPRFPAVPVPVPLGLEIVSIFLVFILKTVKVSPTGTIKNRLVNDLSHLIVISGNHRGLIPALRGFRSRSKG
jgi:hypothetical protein